MMMVIIIIIIIIIVIVIINKTHSSSHSLHEQVSRGAYKGRPYRLTSHSQEADSGSTMLRAVSPMALGPPTSRKGPVQPMLTAYSI